MANRNSTNVAVELDKLNEADAASVLSFISQLRSSNKLQSKDKSINDPLIGSLSDAYENQRARQVTEWEKLHRQHIHRAA
jgi:hypothetical protein